MDEGADRESAFWLIDLIILAVVMTAVFSFIGNVGEVTTYQKRYLASDLALLMDTLYSVPGDLTISYPQNTLWFSYHFKSSQVEVFESESDPLHLRTIRDFQGREKPVLQQRTIMPENPDKPKESFLKKYLSVFDLLNKEGLQSGVNLTFIKRSDRLEIAKEMAYEQKALPCEEENMGKEIVFLLDNSNEDRYENASIGAIGKIQEKSKGTEDDVLLIYLTYSQDTKVYYSGESNLYAVSCTLANNLPAENIAAIPANKEYLAKISGISRPRQDFIVISTPAGPIELYAALSKIQ